VWVGHPSVCAEIQTLIKTGKSLIPLFLTVIFYDWLASVCSRYFKTSPLSHRSNSLVLTEAYDSRFLTIAESEKALLKADLEADVKYRQLILEAESLIVSMRNSLQRSFYSLYFLVLF